MDILIDFDGTVVTHDFPRIGKDVGAVPVLKQLIKEGHRLILFTMRSDTEEGEYLSDAVRWFQNNNLPLYGIQSNPKQREWTSSPKAYGQLIIDDIGLGMPLTYQYGELKDSRPFVDWRAVSSMLIERGILKSELNAVGDRHQLITTVLIHLRHTMWSWYSFSYCERRDSIVIEFDREKWYDSLPVERRCDDKREEVLQELWKWERTRIWKKLRCTLTAQRYWERKGRVITATSLIEKVREKVNRQNKKVLVEYDRILNEKL